MELTGMASLDDIPRGLPAGVAGQMDWLRRVAQQIVDFCFPDVPPSDLRLAEEMVRIRRRQGREDDLCGVCHCMQGKPVFHFAFTLTLSKGPGVILNCVTGR